MDTDLIKESSLTLAEIKEVLDKYKKEKKLNHRETKTLEYINTFCKLKSKQAEDLKKELNNLNITRLKERHITKIIDILPDDIELLRVILAGEDITIKTEDLNKIIDITKKYA